MIADDIDFWYVDIKDINEEIYKEYTGQSNKIVLDNLTMLAKTIEPEKICIRIPLIPKYNTLEDVQESCLYIWRSICAPCGLEVFDYIQC